MGSARDKTFWGKEEEIDFLIIFMQKLTILSSVPEWIFGSIANNPAFGFTQAESQSALKDEKQVFIDAIGIPDIEKYVKVEVLRVMDGIPKDHSADAYILGGRRIIKKKRDQKEWVDRLIRFVSAKVEDGTPLFGICFGSQVLASAVWGEVDWMKERVIGKGSMTVDGDNKDSHWSHRQAIFSPGEAKIIIPQEQGLILPDDSVERSPIQMIQVANATGVQFHPEFTPEFTGFLVKLMRSQLASEWLNPDEILVRMEAMNGENPSSQMLQGFIKKYYNI